MSKKKKTAPDYPYKLIKVIAKRYGYKGLKTFKQLDSNKYEALVGNTGAKIVIDIEAEKVYLWRPLEQKLEEQ